jgi:hypothetical protein
MYTIAKHFTFSASHVIGWCRARWPQGGGVRVSETQHALATLPEDCRTVDTGQHPTVDTGQHPKEVKKQ